MTLCANNHIAYCSVLHFIKKIIISYFNTVVLQYSSQVLGLESDSSPVFGDLDLDSDLKAKDSDLDLDLRPRDLDL
jgi:hypothetical protein